MKNLKNLTNAQRKILERNGVKDTTNYKYVKTVTTNEHDNTTGKKYSVRNIHVCKVGSDVVEAYLIDRREV